MNQSALKTFAQDARNKLRQLIGARLDYVLTADTAELRQQAAQVNELRAALTSEGRDPLIERVAYTWFNRLAALRFMDANAITRSALASSRRPRRTRRCQSCCNRPAPAHSMLTSGPPSPILEPSMTCSLVASRWTIPRRKSSGSPHWRQIIAFMVVHIPASQLIHCGDVGV